MRDFDIKQSAAHISNALVSTAKWNPCVCAFGGLSGTHFIWRIISLRLSVTNVILLSKAPNEP